MVAFFVPLILGSLLWAFAGWQAYPRELWDVPAFGWVWLAATIAAGILGAARPGHPLRHAGLIFAPLLVVLMVSGLAAGRDFGLLPLGLVAVVVLALPAALLAALAGWLATRRR